MSTPWNPTLDLVGCPECGAPAEVVDRFTMQSTDGPVDHVKVICIRRHWFMMPAEGLPAVAQSRRSDQGETSGGRSPTSAPS